MELDDESLPPAVTEKFRAGFYVHVESMPFMLGKQPKDRPSQVLEPYLGVASRRTVVRATWQELIQMRIATELQIRRVLHLKAPKKLPKRSQYFISSHGLHLMLSRCDRAIQFYMENETARQGNPIFRRLRYNFSYNSLDKACD